MIADMTEVELTKARRADPDSGDAL
ncbi:hypothetical protein MPLB_1110013 [Mesorhizobium sp. ORS 3324]|nr:hypothetical protein MPLB_1110013 [Mesorhizobium sp. ORS 3324]